MKTPFLKNVTLLSSTILFCFSLICVDAAAQSPLPQKIPPQYSLYRSDCLGSDTSDSIGQFRAYIEEFLFSDAKAGVELYSCVNWREGFVKSEGIGKQRSRRAAELVARSNALKTLLVLNLDARFTLQQYFADRKDAGLKIQNVLIKNAAIEYLPEDPKQPEAARAMVTIPFYGISGLYSFFLDDQEIYLQAPVKETPQKEEPAEPLWLIVDAREPTIKLTEQSLNNLRNEDIPDEMLKNLELLKDHEITGIDAFWEAIKAQIGQEQTARYKSLILKHADFTQLEPALFPQILSENGDVLFSMSQVSQDVLLDEGAVEYVVQENTQTAQRPAPALLASASFPLFDVPFPFLKRFQERYDLLAEVKSRKKERGQRAVTVKAIKVSGENRPANVYVSLEEAKKLDNLKGVTIIISSVGGGKGQLLDMLYALSYFQ